MVDKSSDISSGYEYLRNNDFKQCKKLIDKKLPKIKASVERANFRILKLLLLHKTKKLREVEQLKAELISDFKTDKELNGYEYLITYFAKVLREIGNYKSASEVYREAYLKRIDLSLVLDEEQRNNIIKQLIYNADYPEAYKVLTKNFIPSEKNKEQLRLYTLMKYELVFNMAFKLNLLSQTIAKLTFKEILKNYEEYKGEKGYYDILIKYLVELKEFRDLVKYCDDKDKLPFTNAPVDDLLLDYNLSQNDRNKIVRSLGKSIEQNTDKFNYQSYERLINCIVYWGKEVLKEEAISQSISRIVSTQTLDAVYLKHFDDEMNAVPDFSIISGEAFNYIISFLNYQYNYFKENSHFFNTSKSAIIALLSIIHNVCRMRGDKLLFKNQVFSLISSFLPKIIKKQSVLSELSPFFSLMDEEQRLELTKLINKADVSSEILHYKLRAILDKSYRSKDTIIELVTAYNRLSYNFVNPEKGERLDFDDLIILINEVYEDLKQSSQSDYIELRNSVLILNFYSHTISPYNYDITIKLIMSCMQSNYLMKTLELLKFLNFKGPLFESCSYIVFNCFINSNYKAGVLYLLEKFKRWEYENDLSIRKVLWKMFTGRNFFATSELMSFDKDTSLSYFKQVLSQLESHTIVEDKLLIDDTGDKDEKIADLKELTEILSTEQANLMKSSNELIRNQDMFIIANKYELVNDNPTAKPVIPEQIFKFAIDELNKVDNELYYKIPSYRSNYIPAFDSGIFGLYGDVKFIELRNLEDIQLLSFTINTQVSNDTSLRYNELLSNLNSESYVNKILLMNSKLLKITESIKSSDKKAEKLLNELTTIQLLLSEYNSVILKVLSNSGSQKELIQFNLYSFKLLITISKYLTDISFDHKKELKDKYNTIKNSFTEQIKNPLLAIYNSYIETPLSSLEHHSINTIPTFDFIEERIPFSKARLAQIANDEAKDSLKNLQEICKLKRTQLKSAF